MPNYDLGTAEGKIVLDTSGIDNDINRANQSMGRLGKGVNAERVGRDLTTGVSLPLIAAGGYALKTAIDFETAFAGVTKTVDGTEADLARVRQGIIDMSLEIPAGTTEIAAVAEAAGQLGVEVGAIEEFTEVMIALGVSTNLTADQAATDIARITNIMRTPIGDLGNFGAALVDLGNNSATTEHNILEMTNRIAGIANLSNSSEADALSLAATLSAVGVRAEAGGTAVTKTIKDFDEWGIAIRDAGDDMEGMDKKAKKFYDIIGGTPEAFAAFDQLSGVEKVEAFVLSLQDMQGEGANMIETLANLGLQEIRQSDSILRLVGAETLLTDTLAIGRTSWEEETALQEEAQKRYATTASQLQIVRNKADNAARIFGEAMIPILIDVLNAITPLLEGFALMAEAFGRLPAPVRTFIIGALALLAALGPVIFIGARIVRTAQAMVGVFKLVGGAFKLMSLAMAANPIVLLILAVIALVAGFILLYKRSEKFRNFINNLGKDIQKIWGKVVDFFKTLPAVFADIWKSVKDAFSSAWDAISGFFGDIGSAISDAFTSSVNAVTDFVTGAASAIGDFFSELPGTVASGVSSAFSAFVDFLTTLPETIAYWLGFAIGRFIRFGLNLVTTIVGIGINVVGAVIGFMTRLPGIILNALTTAVAHLISWGTTFVTTIIDIGTRFVTALINALISFVTWLPGFLLGIITQIVTWGIEFVQAAVTAALNFVTGMIDILLGLPGQILQIITDIISSFPGHAASFFSGAMDIGVNFVTGLFSGIGDLVGAVWDMVNNAINGIGDLGSAAYNRMQSIGSSMWNGFKDGLGISSPSFIEEAAFAIRDNLGDVIHSLGSQVRTMQTIGRGVPTMAQSPAVGSMTAMALSSAASAGRAADQAVSDGTLGGWHQNAPLIGQATIRDDSDIDKLAEQLERRWKREARGRGLTDTKGPV